MITSLDFGCAAKLYANGQHCRLLMSPDDVDKLRAASRQGWGAKILADLRAKLTPLVAGVNECKDLPALLGDPAGVRNGGDPKGREIAANADIMALVGLLDADAAVLDAARKVLTASPTISWNEGGSVLAYDLMQPHLTKAERAAFITVALAQIDRLTEGAGASYVQAAGGNIPMTYMLGALGYCLAIFGDEGVPDLTEKRDRLITCFEAALYSALGPEGYPAEDIGYGTLMTSRLMRWASVLRRAGFYDAFERCPRLARFGGAMLHFVQPWGEFLSNTGDHGDDFGHRDLSLAHLSRLNSDPTLIWLLTTLYYPCIEPRHRDKLGPGARETAVGPGMHIPASATSLITLADAASPVHPRNANVPTAFKDSDRGIVSFRSGWRDNDTFVYFDGSQRPTSAQGHAHDSAGHFCLSSVGEYFAVSPGRYGIEQDQHNTLLVDGKSGRSTEGEWRASWYQGRLTAYRPDPLCDYAAADASQQANCYWSYRHIGLVKCGDLPGYAWTVDDVNGANDFRSFWWTMYTAPGNTISITGNVAQVRGARAGGSGGLLDVHFAVPAADCYPKPHGLELTQDVPWTSSHKYVSRDMANEREKWYVHHATYNRPRLVAKVGGYNGRVMALMIPRESGAAAVDTLRSVKGSLAMRVLRGGFEDTIIFAFGHNLLEANGVRGRGRWLVVRRDEKRRVVAHAIEQGDWLEVDGKGLKV